jgi:Rrf2 family protein
MTVDNRFAVATHCIAVLAFSNGDAVSANYIASAIVTNPVMVRQIMGLLKKGNLVKSHSGSKGGFQLARSPHEITLLDIYRSINPKRPFTRQHGFPASDECEGGERVHSVLIQIYERADTLLEEVFRSNTMQDILDKALDKQGAE